MNTKQPTSETLIGVSEEAVLPDSMPEDAYSWYAVRLFTLKTQLVTNYLEEQQQEYFVPMMYVDYEDKDQHIQHKLKPVVRNLVFLKKTGTEHDIRYLLDKAPFKSSVIKKHRDTAEYYEIPSRQMFEFKAMCNPDIMMRKFLTEAQAKLKVGTPVLVKYGPLQGLTGRLVRSNKKYFLLKEIPGMAVMLKVGRWCCQAMDE